MIPRYSRPEMTAIWSPETRYSIWLEIETLAAEAMAELGMIPKDVPKAVRERGGFNVERIDEIEREVKHDVIAFLTSVAEHVGEEARFLHLGMTSSDVLDTCLAVQLQRASDILQVLALKREFPRLRLVLVGAAEGWRVADRIAAARVPVLANALNDLPATFEQLAATQSNIGRMHAAGVEVAIGMLNDEDGRNIRVETQYAGNLVALTRVPGATGLDWNAAFESISGGPAAIVGMGDQIGTLRPGRRADVVIWDGDPLELSTGVDAVWIDGVRQSLTNHQTELRDRYRQPQEGALPHAYNPRQ